LENILLFLASVMAFCHLTLLHFEWPDMIKSSKFKAQSEKFKLKN